jgi:hypothetical protein
MTRSACNTAGGKENRTPAVSSSTKESDWEENIGFTFIFLNETTIALSKALKGIQTRTNPSGRKHRIMILIAADSDMITDTHTSVCQRSVSENDTTPEVGSIATQYCPGHGTKLHPIDPHEEGRVTRYKSECRRNGRRIRCIAGHH